jgi:hypothetical protein
MNLPSSRAPVLRRTAHEREERRILIMAALRSGFSYEAIARDHQLSRERVRQIVVASLERTDSGTRVDQMRVQMARLEPALRLAARAVENGKLGAIGHLLKKMLDRLDKYSAVAEAPRPYDDDALERLLAELDRARMGPKMGARRPAGTCVAGAADSRGKFSSSQTIEKSRNRVGIAIFTRTSAALQIARVASSTSSA